MTQDNRSPEDKTARAQYPAERLQEAIDGLRKDVTKVEVWAAALSAFSRPVPDYRPNPKFELNQPVRTGPLSDGEGENEPENGSRDNSG